MCSTEKYQHLVARTRGDPKVGVASSDRVLTVHHLVTGLLGVTQPKAEIIVLVLSAEDNGERVGCPCASHADGGRVQRSESRRAVRERRLPARPQVSEISIAYSVCVSLLSSSL